VLWDGGNNDFPFVLPDLHIVLVDALRPDQITTHHPGEAVLRMADVVVVSKSDAATPGDLQQTVDGVRAVNRHAELVRANSPVRLDDPESVRSRRAIVVDDGPTLTHGGMRYGAGYVAAVNACAEIVDPRDSAAPEIRAVFEAFPHIGRVVPAVGYDTEQCDALRRTLEDSKADVVVSGTPFDLARVLDLSKPVVRARYEFEEAEDPGLGALVDDYLASPRRRRLRHVPT
jgi:predicted GTPase